jgi:hypothetical protein
MKGMRKGKERSERARRPEVEREEPQLVHRSARFHVWIIGVDVCGCVRTCIVDKWSFLVNGHVATVVGRQRSRWQPQHNEGSVVAPNGLYFTATHTAHGFYIEYTSTVLLLFSSHKCANL